MSLLAPGEYALSCAQSSFLQYTHTLLPLRRTNTALHQSNLQDEQEAAMQMHQGRKITQVIGKDVVTGVPVVYEQVRARVCAPS